MTSTEENPQNSEVLGDEVSRRLLQTCATAWLHSCCLLNGNIVTIPILSQIYSFKVIGAKTLLANGSQDMTNGSNDGFLDEARGVDHANEALFVKRETKVGLCLPSKRQGSSCVDIDFTISNLGGLSKEYEVLKEIIVSSSSNTLKYGL